ncbi:hypothetical protein [Thioflavicoccus mobilis]|uniref:hypothetical protein n=1 Tax=Thioflavicoccus mobilis TaxID=80679 RepID=UPI0012FCE214|nr:hypothetical protein [Thioflavicoccus mobilis]
MSDIIDLAVYAGAIVAAWFFGKIWSFLLLRGFLLRQNNPGFLVWGVSLIADFSAWLPVIYIVVGLFSGGALTRMSALLGIPFIIGFIPMVVMLYFKRGSNSSAKLKRPTRSQ